MNKLFVYIIIGPCDSRYLFCIHAIPDRVGETKFFNCFSCFFNWVYGTCYNSNLFRLELLYQGLEVS